MFDKILDFLKAFGRAFVFWVIVDPYEGGVVLRLGKFHRMVVNGWNWIWPFYIERVITTDIAIHTLVVGPQSLYTKDGKQVVITTVVTCYVDDSKIFILKIKGGTQALDDAATGVISDLVMSKTFNELLSLNMSNELSKDVRRFAKRWGIMVDRVQIVDFTPMRSIRLLQHLTQTYTTDKEF